MYRCICFNSSSNCMNLYKNLSLTLSSKTRRNVSYQPLVTFKETEGGQVSKRVEKACSVKSLNINVSLHVLFVLIT